MQHHLVIGSGPVGSGIAQRLADQGLPVTVFTRSGTGPVHPSITLVKGDAADAAALARHAEGAATIFNCANPPYHRWGTDWPPMHQAIMTAAASSVRWRLRKIWSRRPANGTTTRSRSRTVV